MQSLYIICITKKNLCAESFILSASGKRQIYLHNEEKLETKKTRENQRLERNCVRCAHEIPHPHRYTKKKSKRKSLICSDAYMWISRKKFICAGNIICIMKKNLCAGSFILSASGKDKFMCTTTILTCWTLNKKETV